LTGEWKECKLGDVITLQRGHDLPKKKMMDGSIPVAGSNGIIGYHNEATTKAPGITIGRSGNLGNAYFYNIDFWAHNTTLYVKDFKGNNELFIYYFLKTFDFKQFNVGSAVPTLNRNHIHPLNVVIPPLPEQRAIASVLSSLDDKIDLLHRQNKTLEAMAETLFRQWFVEEVDEMWEEVDLEYVTEKITDGAHKSPPTVEVGLPMASVKDMHQWGIHLDSCRKISESDFEELVRNDCRPLKNDILIAKDGSYLKHVFVAPKDLDLVILSSIAILRPNGKYHPILLSIYLKMSSTREALENIVTGAVIPRIVLKDFRKFKLKLPPMELQVNALKTLEPIHMRCWQNVNQISTLEKLRDTLLPKLMSGEVRVELAQGE
jgi:type I restriction enzyme S subunit